MIKHSTYESNTARVVCHLVTER